MSSAAVPEVLWAQRSSATEDEKNIIMLTINVPNMTADATKCDLTSTSLKFESTVQGDASKGIEGHKYTFNIDFFENILPAESKQHLTSKCLYLVLRKEKKQEEYWPRLTKEKVRLHNVKTDFDKWVDEDEQDEANEAGDMPFPGGMDMNALMSQMGGGAGGMDFGGMDDDAEDDDDEDKKTSRSSQDSLSGLVVLVNLRLRLKFTRLLIYLFKLNLILYLILVEHIIWILFSRL